MSDSIGTFSAPGAGTVDVLGIELTHDFDSGTKEGVVRLAKRPYWEGALTPCVIEMPATHDRDAQRMTGFWVGRGAFDGEGCNVNIAGMRFVHQLFVGQRVRLIKGAGCHAADGLFDGEICEVLDTKDRGLYDIEIKGLVSYVTGYVNADQLKTIPATPTLDEPTAPADIDWSEIRSATEARDWRRAWQAVGTDHAGDATPGETYLLSKAARAKATAAALVAWRKVEMPLRMARIDERHENGGLAPDLMRNGLHNLARTEEWQRIKRIAGWTSQAAAQYKPPKQAAARHAWNMISTPNGDSIYDAAMQARLYGWDNVRDETLAALQSLQRAVAAQNTNVRPAQMYMSEEVYNAVTRAEPVVLTRGNGGITDTVTIPPSTSRSIAAMLATHATNPNPRGPQPRRRSRT